MARAGSAEAQYQLGVYYYSRAPRNDWRPREGERWITSAASQNHLGAILYLTRNIPFSTGYLWEYDDIARWLERAATLGDAPSATRLGMMLWNGANRVPQDRPKAYQLLRRSAVHGDELALLYLAERALEGGGVQRDPVKARQILAFGASEGILHLRQQAMLVSEKSRHLLLPAEVFRKLEQLGDKGDPDALLLLGLTQANDPDYMASKKDSDRDKRWEQARTTLTKAADLGQIEALAQLGMIYYHGRGTRVDKSRALGFFQRGAAAGNPLSQLYLAELIFDHQVPNLGRKDALDLMTKASAVEPSAMYALGVVYYEGVFVFSDTARAAALLENAAKSRHREALYNLGAFANNGEIGPADRLAAYKWWMLAQLEGSKEAAEIMNSTSVRMSAKERADVIRAVQQWQDRVFQERAARMPELTLK